MKRVRIFAGPNGSGKSLLLSKIKEQVEIENYINADDIELELKAKKGFNPKEFFPVSINMGELIEYYKGSSYQEKFELNETIFYETKGVFYITQHTQNASYYASLIASILRNRLLENEHSFSFETVFSDVSKLEFMEQAKIKGYKIYLYFVCTDDVEINLRRVDERHKRGGHNVPKQKIVERYKRSLGLVYSAMISSDRAYFFDNTNDGEKQNLVLVLEFDKTNDKITFDETSINLNWIIESLIKKLPGV